MIPDEIVDCNGQFFNDRKICGRRGSSTSGWDLYESNDFLFFLDSDYSSLSRSIATQLLHNPHGDFLLTVGHRDHNIKRLDNEAAV